MRVFTFYGRLYFVGNFTCYGFMNSKNIETNLPNKVKIQDQEFLDGFLKNIYQFVLYYLVFIGHYDSNSVSACFHPRIFIRFVSAERNIPMADLFVWYAPQSDGKHIYTLNCVSFSERID